MRIDVEGLSVRYGDHVAVDRVDLAIASGGWLGLIGPNGSGKTSLLRAMCGLVDFEGEVRFDGHLLATREKRKLARLVAVVPQRPVLPPHMSVTDYVLLGRTPHISFFGTESASDRTVASGVIERLELAEFASRPLGSLSGGEAQRAVLARAIAQQAPVLMLDEPTAALDIGHGQLVLELVDELRDERGLSVIAAMHDLTLAGQFADRLALLSSGQLLASGSVREVLSEHTLARHYGTELSVVEDGTGGVAVLPRRRASKRRRAGEDTA